MSDRDPIRERLQRLPVGSEAESVLADLRPAMRRARTTRRLGAAGLALLVVVAGVGGARALSGTDDEPTDRIIVTTTPDPAETPTPEPSPPAPTPMPTPTLEPAPTPSPSATASPAPSPTPQVVEPTVEVFRAGDAATITVSVGSILTIQDVRPEPGWNWSTRRGEPDDVELEFVNDGLRVRWRLRLIDGVAVPEVDISESGGSGGGDDGEDRDERDEGDNSGRGSGPSDNSGPGNAEDRDRDRDDSSGPGSGDDD